MVVDWDKVWERTVRATAGRDGYWLILLRIWSKAWFEFWRYSTYVFISVSKFSYDSVVSVSSIDRCRQKLWSVSSKSNSKIFQAPLIKMLAATLRLDNQFCCCTRRDIQLLLHITFTEWIHCTHATTEALPIEHLLSGVNPLKCESVRTSVFPLARARVSSSNTSFDAQIVVLPFSLDPAVLCTVEQRWISWSQSGSMYSQSSYQEKARIARPPRSPLQGVQQHFQRLSCRNIPGCYESDM